jgi:hypothetical protein
MYKDLFVQSPLLVLPVAAMFLFLATFIAVSLHAATRPRREVEAFSRLPLGDRDEHS